MTSEELKEVQSQMSSMQLLELVEKSVSKMCKTGGASFTMSVPVSIHDTDMLLSELVRRFKNQNDAVNSLYELIQLKAYKDKFGKSEYYLNAQPIVWENAKKVIEKTRGIKFD